MDTAWFVALGFLLAAYFVLGGADYGAAMLTPVLGRDTRRRRALLGALGPFLLGNEVWLVAVAGVLFGAFPLLEGTLLSGLHPIAVVMLLGLVVGPAAVQLRGRARTAAARRLADAAVALGGLLPAAGWGLVVGILLRGVEPAGEGFALAVDPFAALCAVASTAVFLAHGASFLLLRTRGALHARVAACAGPLRLAALAAVVAAGAVGALTGVAVTNPVTAWLLAGLTAFCLAAAWRARRDGLAALATGLAAATPAVLLGAAQYPWVLGSRAGRSVADLAADPASLALLSVVGAVAAPVILAVQAYSWWVMRARVAETSPGYF